MWVSWGWTWAQSSPVWTAGVGPVLLAALQLPTHGEKTSDPSKWCFGTNGCRMGKCGPFIPVAIVDQ